MLAFLQRNFRWIAGGFLLTYCSTFGQTYFIAGSIGEWQQRFTLSHGEIGRLYMLATLASALMLPWIGRTLDALSAQRAVIVFMPLLALAAVLAATAWSVPMLVLAIFGLRLCGQGMMTHIALTETGRTFVAGRGRAVSLVVLGHQGGEATLPIGFALLVAATSFTTGWLVSAAALLLVGLPLATWAFARPRAPGQKHADDPEPAADVRHWTRAEVLRDPWFYWMLLGVLGPAFIGTTIFYHRDYMTDLMGWPDTLFASSLIVMAATTVLFALVFGQLIDRFGAVRLLPILLLPLCAACLAMSVAGAPWTLFVVITLVGMSYGISSTILGALWPEV